MKFFILVSLCMGFPLSPIHASNGTSRDQNLSATITVDEAEGLLNFLPAVKELRAKGMVVKWDVQTIPTMNSKDYYFFWIYNTTAQRQRDIASIAVGNYAVNKHTADMRAWRVSDEVFHGNDGELVTTNELEQRQEDLRKKHGIDSTLIHEYRFAHLANKIIPREQAQAAVRLPITDRSRNTGELSCWKDGDHLISRLGRSPIFSSSAGYRAYAEVKATAFKPIYQETYSGSLCENSVKLFFARDGASKFQTLLGSDSPKKDCAIVEGGEACEVNGIQLVDWSKDGRFLLADLVLWVYESDAILMHAPVVYDVTKGEFMRPDVYHFFDEYYKTSFFKEKAEPSAPRCEFALRTEGFSPDGNIIISTSRPPDDPSFEGESCLDKKQTFLFDLGTNKIKPLSSNYIVQHYGTWNSKSAPKP